MNKKNGRCVLEQGTIHYWVAELTEWEGQLGQLRSLLSPPELKRIERIRIASKRQSSLISAGLLRLILAAYLPVPPERLEIPRQPAGKPFLEGSPLHFNLSHSGSLLIWAAALNSRIGIDIQQVYPISKLEHVSGLVFCPPEQAYLDSVPESQQLDVLFRIWTAKEAYLKAIGSGFQEPASRICLLPDQIDPRFFVLADPGSSPGDTDWTIQSLDIHPDYRAALAVNGTVRELLKVEFHPQDYFGADQRPLQSRISRTS